MAYNDIPPFLYLQSTSTAAVVVKANPGILHTITIGTASTGNLQVWDNTTSSGTIILSCPTTSVQTFILDVAFNTGLTVKASGGSYTVAYF
jgi:hypothetical protein